MKFLVKLTVFIVLAPIVLQIVGVLAVLIAMFVRDVFSWGA